MFEGIKTDLLELVDAFRSGRWLDVPHEMGDCFKRAADLSYRIGDVLKNWFSPLTGAAEGVVVNVPAEVELLELEKVVSDLQAECMSARVTLATTGDSEGDPNAKIDPATILLIVQLVANAIKIFREWRKKQNP